MTIILRRYPGWTDVVIAEPQDTTFSPGKRFLRTAVPRSLDDDRHLLAALSEPDWYGVCVEDVTSPADIEKVSALLRVAAVNRARPSTTLPIIAVLDTAPAALGLEDFNRAIPGLAALLFDGEALSRAAGTSRDADLVVDLRRRLPLAARASGAIAILVSDEDDTDQAAIAAREGYAGLCVRDKVETI